MCLSGELTMADNAAEVERLRDALGDAKREAERDRATIETLRSEARGHQGEALHYIRNTLAVVRSIVSRTVGEEETAEDFQARLISRLASFARLQSHLFRNPATGVDLYLLIADELLAFDIRVGAEACVEEVEISILPKAASVLGGAFHELARMAIEGGFESSEGRIAVRCEIAAGATADPCLEIDWTESGRRERPALNAATEFDRDVEGAVAYELAGTVSLSMTSDGLNCRFRLPAKWLVSSPAR